MTENTETLRSDKYPYDDRRAQQRTLTNIEFSFFLNGQQFSGFIENISLSGAFLSELQPALAPEDVAQSGKIDIRLNGEPLSLACKIVYIVPTEHEYFPIGAGVVFNKTDPSTQTAIAKIAADLKLGLERPK